MDVLEIASIPVIIVVVYLILEVYKSIIKGNEKAKNFIPLIAAVLGGALGVLLYFVFPTIINTDNVINAIVTGVVSGLGATGTNQVVKQLQKLLEGVKNGTGTE